jgi:hypothetical protein
MISPCAKKYCSSSYHRFQKFTLLDIGAMGRLLQSIALFAGLPTGVDLMATILANRD